MNTDTPKFVIRSKIWIEDDSGKVVFGEGRCRMLLMIEQTRSLQGAARELKMSYRALWGRIKASEQRLGRALVDRDGRGTCLTPFASELIKQYGKVVNTIHRESDRAYSNLMSDRFQG